MGVLINEQRQQKNEIITAVNRNVPNFSLETEKAKFEINDRINLCQQTQKYLLQLNTLNFFMMRESEHNNLN